VRIPGNLPCESVAEAFTAVQPVYLRLDSSKRKATAFGLYWMQDAFTSDWDFFLKVLSVHAAGHEAAGQDHQQQVTFQNTSHRHLGVLKPVKGKARTII
jgi:hypothetical protein